MPRKGGFSFNFNLAVSLYNEGLTIAKVAELIEVNNPETIRMAFRRQNIPLRKRVTPKLIKNCIVCGKPFEGVAQQKFCSTKCKTPKKCFVEGCDSIGWGQYMCVTHKRRKKAGIPLELPITPWNPNRTYWLYRVYNKDRQLLYVGISLDTVKRFNQHEKYSDWWKVKELIEMMELQGVSKSAAMKIEKDAIHLESPLFNIVHNQPMSKTEAG